jgi:hypothetical protein
MKKNLYLGLFLLIAGIAHSQVIPPGDYHGANITMASGQSLTGGHYFNVGTFLIPTGVSIPIAKNTGVVRITANQINIGGVLNGNAAGFIGGVQASCPGSNGGISGSGTGGGTGGAFGSSVHGNGGAGGGYGGSGGDSGNALATPQPSLGGIAYGDITNASIEMGSGGGSGSNYVDCQSIGGRGGAGGGGIQLESPNIILTGQINARGENGFPGTRQTSSNIFASGGAGSGGGVLLIGGGTIGGLIDVNGGNGGNSPNAGFSIGGGGGAGGRIKIYGNFTTTAVLRANGGNPGTSFATAQSQSKPGQLGTITVVSNTPTIETQAMELSEFCAGTENVLVHFATTGDFGPSNTFTAQLSNSSGNFSTPINIGTSTTPGLITATLPGNLASGSAYRFRVISSDPAVIGTDNGANITINDVPIANLSGTATICPGTPTLINIVLTGESPWSGVYTDGTSNIPFNATASPLYIPVFPAVTTPYALISVSDANCNGSVSGTAIVTVQDTEAPVPDITELPVLTAECTLTANPPTATDNCKGQVAATTEDPITFNTQGTFTINWTYADDHGNSTTQQQTVVIDDVTAPVLSAPLGELMTQCAITISVAPTATDNCTGTIAATTTDPLSYDVQGTYTIHWTFDDGNGNTLATTQTIIIDDTEAPALNSPLADLTAECGLTVSSIPTATDNCLGTITATTTDPLSYDAQGTFTIHWIFDDGNGNTLEATQTVIINDTEAPVLGSPLADLTAQCGLTVSVIPTATDNCSGTITATTADVLTYNAQGTYTIQWTFDDGNGNTLVATQTVIIDDTEAPTLDSQLADLTAQCGLTVSVMPTATDNCSGTITATTVDPLSYDAQGTYSIHWTFDDGNGNILESTQTVIIDDTEAPVLGSPLADMSAECELTISSAPTATDNCGAVIVGTTEDPLTYSHEGTFTIRWKFDDGNGNILEAVQTVTIDDTQAPVPVVGTLPDINGGCSAVVSVIPTATDNCTGPLQATTTDPLMYTVPGTHIITWTYNDGNGNTSQQIQNVIIEDNAAPVIPAVEFEISSASTAGVCGRVVEFEDPTPTDNCAVVRFERTDATGLESGDVFPAGTTVISYEAEDAAGHITEASFSITIANASPVITSVGGPVGAKPVNANITITAQFVDDNANTASITWGDGAVTTASLTSTSLSGQHRYTDAGVYSVVIALTDACGEVAESTVSLVVFDQNAGHVTGAGLFNSPRDAYRDDRHVSCIGVFEFNVKYKNGSSVPSGKTEFRLLASNLRFKSTSYEWLVISGDKAIYKGKGELNGQKGYNFLVSAVDVGKLFDNNSHQWKFIIDKFRIKIWNAAGVVIYDNQPGAADGDEPTTQILGAIVIHKGTRTNMSPGMRERGAPIAELNTETKLSVYPNPFIDVITVQLDPQVNVNPTIQLFDTNGRALYDKEHAYQESGTYSINAGDVTTKSGMYLLRINQGSRIEVIKVFGGAR